jgi:hypothetical protein
MNRIATLALFVAATFITVDNASAQNQVKVNVPFSFTVGTSTMPAGSYTIKSDFGSRNLVYLTNWGAKAESMALGIPEQGNPSETSKLVFHRVGDQYFLSEIRCESASMNIHFPVTKAEKRVRAQIQTAGLRVNDNVLIALK